MGMDGVTPFHNFEKRSNEVLVAATVLCGYAGLQKCVNFALSA